MFQYRLSTLFLIFFVVATTMALFGALGVFAVVSLLLAAFCINQTKNLNNGIVLASLLILLVFPSIIDFFVIGSTLDNSCPDRVDAYIGPSAWNPWTIILGVVIWLVSVVLLFHRAVISRKKPTNEANI